MIFDSKSQISSVLQAHRSWSELTEAYETFTNTTIGSRLRALRESHFLDRVSRDLRLTTLRLLGFPLDSNILDEHTDDELILLCLEYPKFAVVSNTLNFSVFLGYVLKSNVVVTPLYTKDYSVTQITGVVDSVNFTIEVDVAKHVRLVVTNSQGITFTEVDGIPNQSYQYVRTDKLLTFNSEQANEPITINVDGFVRKLPDGAIRLEDGGHWFLSTHVEVEFDWDVIKRITREGESIQKKAHDIFYGFAPLNLVLRTVGTTSDLDFSPLCVCTSIGQQVAIQKI